jgi:hypothetical protein
VAEAPPDVAEKSWKVLFPAATAATPVADVWALIRAMAASRRRFWPVVSVLLPTACTLEKSMFAVPRLPVMSTLVAFTLPAALFTNRASLATAASAGPIRRTFSPMPADEPAVLIFSEAVVTSS